MKIYKLANDPCFGQKCGSVTLCGNCVIKRACEISQKNSKNKKEY